MALQNYIRRKIQQQVPLFSSFANYRMLLLCYDPISRSAQSSFALSQKPPKNQQSHVRAVDLFSKVFKPVQELSSEGIALERPLVFYM